MKVIEPHQSRRERLLRTWNSWSPQVKAAVIGAIVVLAGRLLFKAKTAKMETGAASKEELRQAPPVKESQLQAALAKYKELYNYSTDVLLKEHERFHRADEKATKYAAIFVFLIGIVTYFDKWLFQYFLESLQPNSPATVPDLAWQFAALAAGAAALITSMFGWFLSHHVIMLRPYQSRPLNAETIAFFDKQTLLNIYYSFAKANSQAYLANVVDTNKKYRLLAWAYRLMLLVLSLSALIMVFYSWRSLP
jgi:hypothetical protein